MRHDSREVFPLRFEPATQRYARLSDEVVMREARMIGGH